MLLCSFFFAAAAASLLNGITQKRHPRKRPSEKIYGGATEWAHQTTTTVEDDDSKVSRKNTGTRTRNKRKKIEGKLKNDDGNEHTNQGTHNHHRTDHPPNGQRHFFDLITLSRKIHLFCAFVRINLFIWKHSTHSHSKAQRSPAHQTKTTRKKTESHKKRKK